MSRPIKEQVRSSVEEYVAKTLRAGGYSAMERNRLRPVLSMCVLSGLSLGAGWLVSNDGSETATPQALQKAVQEVGQEMGLGYGRLKDGPPPKEG